MEAGALRVEEEAVVEGGPKLALLFAAWDQADLVAELPAQELLMRPERIEVDRLVRGLDVARSFEGAVDPFLRHEALDEVDGRQRGAEDLPSPLAPEAAEERLGPDLLSRQDLPSVPRAGSPADRLPFEHHHRGAPLGEGPGGREPRVPAADDGDVGSCRPGTRGRLLCVRGKVFPPVRRLAQGRHFLGLRDAISCFAMARSRWAKPANCCPEKSASAPSMVTRSPVW